MSIDAGQVCMYIHDMGQARRQRVLQYNVAAHRWEIWINGRLTCSHAKYENALGDLAKWAEIQEADDAYCQHEDNK